LNEARFEYEAIVVYRKQNIFKFCHKGMWQIGCAKLLVLLNRGAVSSL